MIAAVVGVETTDRSLEENAIIEFALQRVKGQRAAVKLEAFNSVQRQ